MSKSIIKDKSFDFAIRIVNLYKYLCTQKQEYIISKQLLRSGTSIGANVKEALSGQSKRDFLAKMNIALKEASESEYWIELLIETEYLKEYNIKDTLDDCKKICKMLSSIVKTTKATVNLNYYLITDIWGRNGFDGDVEARAASSGTWGHYKTWEINLNANDNLALAA